MTNYLIYIAILGCIFFAISKVFPMVKIRSFPAAFGIAIIFAVLNSLLGGLLTLIFKMITLMTIVGIVLWIFSGFFVNLFLIYITDKFMKSFEIKDFKWTAVTAAIISGSSFVLNKILFPITKMN